MFSSTALLFPVTLTASFIMVCCLSRCQSLLVRADPHWFRSVIPYRTRPLCSDTLLFACRAKWLWPQLRINMHLSAFIWRLPSPAAGPGPALPGDCHQIFLSSCCRLIIQMRRKWVFMFCFCLIATSVKIIEQGTFALSLPSNWQTQATSKQLKFYKTHNKSAVSEASIIIITTPCGKTLWGVSSFSPSLWQRDKGD